MCFRAQDWLTPVVAVVVVHTTALQIVPVVMVPMELLPSISCRELETYR
jgi:hypothetical protein